MAIKNVKLYPGYSILFPTKVSQSFFTKDGDRAESEIIGKISQINVISALALMASLSPVLIFKNIILVPVTSNRWAEKWFLARDPRGLFRSRRALHSDQPEQELVQNVTALCTNQLNSHNQYKSHKNYLPILYENVNRYPYDEAAKIYKFLGVNYSNKTDMWIKQNTEIKQKVRKSRQARRGWFALEKHDNRGCVSANILLNFQNFLFIYWETRFSK